MAAPAIASIVGVRATSRGVKLHSWDIPTSPIPSISTSTILLVYVIYCDELPASCLKSTSQGKPSIQ